MTKASFTLPSSDGGTLYGFHWPVENPRSIILIVHGLGEHIHRFEHLAKRYNDAGMAVAGFDHPGHGQSSGKRGHARNLDDLLANIHHVVAEVKKRHPDTPVFLHGQSMGGNLAMHYGLQHPEAIRGVLASSPWIRLAFPDPKSKVAIGQLLSSIWPSMSLATGLVARNISRIPEVVQAYITDPLVHNRISASLGMTMLRAARMLNEFAAVYPVPLLLLHGDADGLTSHNASADFAQRVSGNVAFRSWPGAYHELHNEPEQAAVFAVGLAWVEGELRS